MASFYLYLSIFHFRLCPYFRTRERKAISSNTYSNKIDPFTPLCHYDLSGKCLDENCKSQHASNVFKLSEDELLQDLIAYEPSIACIVNGDLVDTKKSKINKCITRLREQYKNKMSIDQLALLLINSIKEIRREKSEQKSNCYYYNVALEQKLKFSSTRVEEADEARSQIKSKIWNFGKSSVVKNLPKDKGER